ncbi:MAG: hypothetical protein IPK82_12950 [Polyangiaceae bacterium]|nr:hypothetical protein [Polyangiaceae bacterium]
MALGFTILVAYTFFAALGGCGGSTWPANGKLPDGVVERLHECGKKGPTPLTKVNFDLTYTLHVAEDNREAWVDEVMLINSTLNIPEVEGCMADALRGMRTPLEALARIIHEDSAREGPNPRCKGRTSVLRRSAYDSTLRPSVRGCGLFAADWALRAIAS